MNLPKLTDLNFPHLLVGVCDSSENFDEAIKLIIEGYSFVPSPIEEGRSDRALVLPIPGIDLEKRFKGDYDDKGFGWGIGRVRFDKKYCNQRGGPSFEFKYFLDECPRGYLYENPMKQAIIKTIEILKPEIFLDFLGKKISNPYN